MPVLKFDLLPYYRRVYSWLIFLFTLIFSWNSVIQNIESKFEDYLNAESRVNRTTVQDTRVHCCLYFIAPSGHG